MAYYDVLSSDSYGRFNRKLAKLTTLETAIYWSEILDIIPHVIKKKKSDANGFFKLDRKYVEDRTCISLADQLDLDSILENIGVLNRDIDNTDLIRVNLAEMEKILVADDIKKLDLPKNKTKVSRSQAAENKKAAVITTMKNILSEVDGEVRRKYEGWVDSVYASKRFLTKVKIQTFESVINTFTSDPQVKKDILDIGIQTGWDNAEWLINKYNTNKKNTPTQLTPQKTSTGVSNKFEF